MNSSEYKKYHESFMQNNQGSTAVHTFMCILFTLQCAMLCAIIPRRKSSYQLILEYFIMVLPLIIAHTAMSDYIYVLNIVIVVILVNVIKRKTNIRQVKETLLVKNAFQDDKIKSITCLRGLTYLITGFCILAVDFKQFPRYLAKTEKYGYSLMDTGVGLFIIISGLVHRDLSKSNYVSVLKGNLKFIIILITLGIARYVSLKKLEYQEHITEYGVHWNFFFTLAICKLTSTIFLLISSNALFLSILTICSHELFLTIGLQDWVFGNTDRNNFLNANREGISSSLGYVSLYLFAVYLKNVLKNNKFTRGDIVKKLATSALLLIIITLVINTYRPISRALANAGYCFYLSTITLLGFCVMYPLEMMFQNKKSVFTVPLILFNINNNGLLYFLICNISTGVINMLFRTLLLSNSLSFIILNLYMITNISLTIYLTNKGIKL